MAEQRIKGPVTLLSPSLINQSGARIMLSQPLGAAHVRMQGGGGGVGGGRGASQPVSAVDCSSISTANLMTRGLAEERGPNRQPPSTKSQSLISTNGLLFCTTSAILITIP